MNLTLGQLLDAFATYNQSIWPAQVIAYLLSLVALLPLLRPSRPATRLATAILAFYWLWISLMFWWPARSSFPPAPLLTVIFVLQGVLFLAEAVKPHLSFHLAGDAPSVSGVLLIGYALIYPLVGLLFGHVYPRMALSSLFPCPLVVFTLGLLLTSRQKVPKYLLFIPLFWSLSGFYWAFLGMREDVGLIVAGLLGAWLIWRRDREVSVTEHAREAASAAR